MTFSASALPRGDRPSPGADWSWCATEDAARAMFARYEELGGNFIDTADVYAGGTSEPLVGSLVAAVRDRVVLATKFGLSVRRDDIGSGGSSYRTMIRAVERSLDRMATDRIDMLWLHAWDGITPLDEIARGLDALVQSGKVLYVGVSDSPAWAIALLHAFSKNRTLTPITAVQLRYSVAERSAELELLPMARHLGLGVTAFGVLGGGVLSAKYRHGAPGRRDRTTLGPQEVAGADAVAVVSQRSGCTPAQVAVAWVRARRPSIVPIIGARTVAQLDDALGAVDVVLDPEDVALLDAVASPPRLFPHDVLDAVRSEVRGGTLADRLDLPPSAAF